MKLPNGPLYQKIESDLKNHIEKGDYKDGERIPSINKLMDNYDVSHITILRALSELAEGGYIDRIRGKGCFVRQVNASRKREVLGVIGCVIRTSRPPTLTDNYFNEILHGIQLECMKNKFHVLQPHCNETLTADKINHNATNIVEAAILEIKSQVDGFVMDERIPDEVISKVIEFGIPVVSVNRASKLDIDSVAVDNEGGARQIAELSLSLGYKSFIIASSEEDINSIERSSTFQNVLIEKGIPQRRIIVDMKINSKTPERIKEEYMDYVITLKGENNVDKVALFATTDSFARYLSDFFLERGLSRETGIGVIGFLGLGYAYYKKPIITTLKVDTEKLGRKAVEVLLEKINHSEIEKKQVHRFPVTIEYGETL